MENSFKEKIIKRITELDPHNNIVKINEANKTITYNKVITGWDNVKYEDEGFVRALIVVGLVCKNGYNMEEIVLEKHYNIGSNPEAKNAFLDILIRDRRDRNKSYMLLEVKTPEEYESKKKNLETQLFNIGAIQNSKEGEVKYLVYISLEEDLSYKMIVIDFQKYSSFRKWKEDIENGVITESALNKIQNDYGIVSHANYANCEDDEKYIPLNKSLTKKEMTKLGNDLHNIGWGGGSNNYNDVVSINNSLFMAKIYDERMTPEGSEYKFQLFYEDEKPEDPEKTFSRISDLYKKAITELCGFSMSEINTERFVSFEKISRKKFIDAVERLQGISLTENNVEGDILGEFFESIMTSEFKQDKGQFFTHYLICLFTVLALEIDKDAFNRIKNSKTTNLAEILPYFIDPSAGSATFLIQVLKIVSKYYQAHKSELNLAPGLKRVIERDLFIQDENDKNAINSWGETYVYGIEPNAELAVSAMLNLGFHGVHRTNIIMGDGLAPFRMYHKKLKESRLTSVKDIDNYETNEQFDYVISNPPFSLLLAMAEAYNRRFIYSDKKNSENLFIERWWQLLKEGGKMGVLLPDSVLDTTENKYIREFLYRYFKIDAIISLDKSAFQPYTSTKVSILIATKKTSKEVENYELEWNLLAGVYKKLRGSKVVKFILENDKLVSSLERLANKYNLEGLNERIALAHNYNYSYVSGLLEQLIPQEVFNDGLREELEKALGNCTCLEELFDENKMSSKMQTNVIIKLLYNIFKFIQKDALSKLDFKESQEVLKKYLREYFPINSIELQEEDQFINLLEHCYEDITTISKIDYPNWTTDLVKDFSEKYSANTWWVFSQLSKIFDYKIFMAHAENIGYKRNIRGEIKTKNDLMSLNDQGDAIIDIDNPKTILDHYLRSRKL